MAYRKQVYKESEEVKMLRNSLLKKDRRPYEKNRANLIKKYGYNQFREIQLKAFKSI